METDQISQHLEDNMDDIDTNLKLEEEDVALNFGDPIQNMTTDSIKEEVDEEIKYSDHFLYSDQEHEGIKKHSCKQCNYSSDRKSNLVLHVESVHEGLKNFPCLQCDYRATKKCNLAQHVSTVHEGLKNFPCKQCDYRATRKGYLTAHVESVHDGIKKHSCHLCDYCATKKSNLVLHVESVHEGIKKHKCEQCDFSTTRKGNLAQHVESIHEKIKNYDFSCEHCEFMATTKSYLTRHVASVHEGIKFSCDQCDYKANQKSHIKQHVASIHEGITYDCEQCTRKFTQKIHLQNHIATIHEGIKYYCELCTYEAKQKRSLQKHVAQVHVSSMLMTQLSSNNIPYELINPDDANEGVKIEYSGVKIEYSNDVYKGVSNDANKGAKIEDLRLCLNKIEDAKKGVKINEEPMPDIKEEPKDEDDLVSGLVCEPELDNLLVKKEPMDSNEEMDQSEGNDASTPFISTVKEEPVEEEPFISTVKEEPSISAVKLEPGEVSEEEEPSKYKKVFPVAGGMLIPIPPGTKISSPNVARTTTSEALVTFGQKLTAGVYKFMSHVDGSQSIFIIKDDGGEGKKAGIEHYPYQRQPSTASLKLYSKAANQYNRVKTDKQRQVEKKKSRKTPLEFFSREVEVGMRKRNPELHKREVTKMIIDRWMKMTIEEKEVYKNMVGKEYPELS